MTTKKTSVFRLLVSICEYKMKQIKGTVCPWQRYALYSILLIELYLKALFITFSH